MNQIFTFFNRINSGVMLFKHKPEFTFFCDCVAKYLDAQEISIVDNNTLKLLLRNKVLFFGYKVQIKIHDKKLIYNFECSNIYKIFFTAILVGAFMFRGNIATYFFWAFLVMIFGIMLNTYITKNFINKKIQQCINNCEPTFSTPLPNQNISISYQKICPACGCFINGFSQHCTDCGLNLSAGKTNNFGSVSNHKNMEFKYFLK